MDIATTSKSSFGLTTGVNSHLIKNSEWGAVAYLCYSKCGNVPMTNGTGILVSNSHWYNLYTGQGPKSESDQGWYDYDVSHNYSTSNGVLSSTTRNVTGVYDMAGGALERVAGYLDNSNSNLNTYGVSDDGTVKYFENGKINSRYASLWDSYEVSEEEKNNKITLSDGTVETELWDSNKRELKYQEARYRLTKYTYEKMANHKGIGVNEVSSTFAFYAPSGKGNGWKWYLTAKDATEGNTNYAISWDEDMIVIGHINFPFIVRGGHCSNVNKAGILSSYIAEGYALDGDGFRATLTV